MNEGRIIEYIDQGKFVCTLCLQDKGNRLHLLTPSNRQINLSPKRAILISGSTIDTSKPREELIEKLKETEETRNRLRGQIDVRELWELTKDENEVFDNKYLAHLAFGVSISDDHLSALVRALFENRLHFKMKDGRFRPNSEERVQQIKKQKEEEARKEEWINQGSAWLKDVQEGREAHDPPCRNDIIKLLIQLAVFGKEDPDFKYGKEILSRAGISDIRETRNLLIRLGVWEEDENLDLLRLGIETAFTQEQLGESVLLAGSEIDFRGCEDLRHIPAFTIDGPLTRDFDDALSLELKDDSMEVGVHISDVAASVKPDSHLDRAAMERTSSLYLPRRQISMIPPQLSQDALSLKKGCDRKAISLLARFSKTGQLLDYRFLTSIIRVQACMTYDEVNEILGTDGSASERDPLQSRAEPLRQMHILSRRLRQGRMNRGAVSLSLPELYFSFEPDASLSLEVVEQNTPSRMMVAELMILYNLLAATFCRDNQIPVIFRCQEEPSQRLTMEESNYLFYVFQQRRKLSPLYLTTTPNPHSGLGLELYVQSTSPIRRYLDLVIQRQIKAFIEGTTPVLDNRSLEEIKMIVEPTLKTLEFVKRNRLRYWVLKYLSQHMGQIHEAIVLDELKRKYRVVLKRFLHVAEIKKQNGTILSPGDEISVEVKKVDPWEETVELAYADK
jgi:exoribonuclease-2